MDVAKEILRQLGGNKFLMMTGAKNLVGGENSLSFSLPGSGGFTKNGINLVRITLTPNDLYTVEYIKRRGTTLKVIAKSENIYNDMLQSDFTEKTGLYTRM